MPTDMDIKRIRESFPDVSLKIGQVITYEELAKVIDQTPGSNRFRSVVTRWRKMLLRDSAVVLKNVATVGYRVADSADTLSMAYGKYQGGLRSVRRGLVLNAYVDRKKLTMEQQKSHDHLNARTAAVIAAAQLKSGSIELPKLV